MVWRVGATLAGWSRGLRSYAADHAPDMDVLLVRDQRAALDAQLSVICLDASTVWVTHPLIVGLRDAGVQVVGVYSDEVEQRRWVEWDVAHRIRADVPPDAMVFLLDTLRPRNAAATVADVSAAGGGAGERPPVVVGGPSGSGARELALGIAARLSVRRSTVLVDCNESGGTVAPRLALGEHPNLLAAVPVAEAGGDLSRVVTGPVPGRGRLPFDVIGGLPSAAEWTRVTPAGVQGLVHACTQRWDAVVAVTGGRVEDLRRWADRFGVSRELLGAARVPVGVCAATPHGVLAFAEWLADARPTAAVQVVINRVPAGSAFVRGEVAERLRSLCGDRIEVVGAVPWDRRVVRAEWDATLVGRGPYARALVRLVDSLALDAEAVAR